MGSILSYCLRGEEPTPKYLAKRRCRTSSAQLPNAVPLLDMTNPDQHTPQTSSPRPPTTILQLWDPANPDQQQIVSKHHTYKDVFRGKLAELREYVQPELLWAHLIDLEVIDRQTRDAFLNNATPGDAVERLVHHLEARPTWQLHSFLRALAKQDQPAIIELLGFKIVDYQDPPATCQPPPSLMPGAMRYTNTQKPHYYKKVESDEKMLISNDLLPGLLEHCGSYNQTLMKTGLFGFKKDVPIDLTELYVCHNISCMRNQRKEMAVGKKELFLRLFGTRCPNCLSLEGAAGAGKSSFLENYAHEWSKDFTACEDEGPDVPCGGHLWKLVVYIPSGTIRGSAADAIRDNLRCEPHLQKTMICAIEKDGDGVVILYDAMDELRNKESITSISSYIQTSQQRWAKPKVLVAARHGLLSVERRFFDRELYLEGFSISQGLAYMETYFKKMYSIQEDSVLEYVKAHPKDLEWVLSNPLRVHIMSELSACGHLTLHDVKTLTTVKLVNSLDRLLLERDKACRPTSSAEPSMFYQACLRCLLTDTRTLSEEDVGTESPYMSFLTRHIYMGQDFNNYINFSFPHEMLVEYFGMRGLIQYLKDNVVYKQGMLLYFSSEPKMRNLLMLTCGYIAQYEPQLLPEVVFIIRACLILQTEHVWCERTELAQQLLQLPAIIRRDFPHNVLSNGFTAEQATKLDEISTHIQTLFTEMAECLKENGWFLNGYANELQSYIGLREGCHTFILGCMQQLTHEQRLDVCSQTTHRLLPCTRHNIKINQHVGPGTVTVLPTNGGRWATITQGRETTGLYLGLPCDLAPSLNTWSHMPSPQSLAPHLRNKLLRKITIYIIGSRHPLSMLPSADTWSEEQWIPGLTEVLTPSYCTCEIKLNMGSCTSPPLTGLLSACKKVIKPGHRLRGGLHISDGQVQDERLKEFCTWAVEKRLMLELRTLRVVMSAGRGKEDVKDVDSAIRRMVELGWKRGQLHKPTYVTPDGEVLCEPK